jgi:hypothetical protein
MDLILHIGAHRTGSTAFEQSLSINAARLVKEGVTLWSPRDLRGLAGFADLPQMASAPMGDKDAAAGLAAARAVIARAMAGQPGKTLVLSEENMLGSMGLNLRKRSLYPTARARLLAYAAALPQVPRRVGLGIRSYAGFWVSSYLYVLRRRALVHFDQIAAELANAPRGWREVVADVRHAFPESEICLWSAETLGTQVQDIACTLIDCRAEGMEKLQGRVNAGLRMTDIPRIFAARTRAPDLNGAALDAALADMPPMPYSAFTLAQAATMAARYAEDLHQFSQGRHGVRLLTPDPGNGG